MEIKYDEITWTGPVRSKNEDALGFLQPHSMDERRWRGVVCVICDGVGGQRNGDVASQLAVRKALDAYLAADDSVTPSTLLHRMFDDANLAVYDGGMAGDPPSRMATTMTISLFRDDEVHIGHVGDCRVYLVRGATIRCITSDHSYSGMQMKLGLISQQEAADSRLRYVLTRSVGREPFIQIDFYDLKVVPGDVLVQCCDGVYTCMTEQEIYQTVISNPDAACHALIELCDRRAVDDNVSVQVVQIRKVERVISRRGVKQYESIEQPSLGQDLKVDDVLDDRFRILETISRSGMATIYRATDLKTEQTVVLKVPHLQFESDPTFFDRFKREELIGAKLNHPSIINILPTGDVEKSRIYLVMEYLRGQTLGNVMKSIKPMPEADVLKIGSRLCDALQYLHEHDIVHRDLKPDNIMICDDGSLRLMDFGIAKMKGARRLTFGRFQPAMGTPDYMSPEQVKGGRGDARSDLYSLGAILYEMATGSPPYEGNNPLVIMNARLTGDPVAPRTRNPKLSEALEEIVLHAMARTPEDRFQSAADMREALDHPDKVEITGRATRLLAPTPLKPRWKRLAPWLVIGAVAILVIAAAILLRSHVTIQFH